MAARKEVFLLAAASGSVQEGFPATAQPEDGDVPQGDGGSWHEQRAVFLRELSA